jgi:glyoxylase-like metal-dependent hydrolase (beta-lactamase superfamily II)
VIHVPGHTPGSIALYQPERQILFCGDVFFHDNPKKGLQVSPPIVSVDVARARESARKLAALPVKTLCVSHGEVILEDAATVMREAPGR